MEKEVINKAEKTKEAVGQLSISSNATRNSALNYISQLLLTEKNTIIEANKIDLDTASQNSNNAVIDRLKLTEERICSIAGSIEKIIKLPDPLGIMINKNRLDNKLLVTKVSVPLGVVAIVYEARPNVTVDSAVLCIKSGNGAVLRGSRSALNTNQAIMKLIKKGLVQAGLPESAVEGIFDPDSKAVNQLLKLDKLIDVVIPRGGQEFIDFVRHNSTIPVIETGAGNCHIYIAQDADLDMSKSIVINAKVSRPAVCNSAETVLINSLWPEENVVTILKSLMDHNVELLGCPKIKSIGLKHSLPVKIVEGDGFYGEFLDYKIRIKIIDSLHEAIDHINKYGTKHSETIITSDKKEAEDFMNLIDSACIYHNASTRFTDGEEFGFGCEIGISNQKLHARGPMGLPELTSYKYKVYGNGQVR